MTSNNATSKLVSVIIPVYNLKGYLDACMRSVLAQDYENLEVLLVDDGSTDGSAELADAYAASDSRISVIHKDNEGVAKARHDGIRAASGQYVTFLDADDELAPEFIFRAMPYFEEGYDIVSFDYRKVHEDYDSIIHRKGPEEMCGLQYLESLLSCKAVFAIWGKVFRRSLFDDVKYIDYSCAEDLYVNIQTAICKPRVRFVDYAGYNYTIRQGSLSKVRFSLEFINDYCRSVEKLLRDNDCRIDHRADELSSLIRLAYYIMYISRSRNDWAGDSSVALHSQRIYERHRDYIRTRLPHYKLRMLLLDRYRSMRWSVKMIAAYHRVYGSLAARFRMA